MNKNLDRALSNALEEEFLWTNDFKNPYEEYTFSPQFEKKIKAIINMSEHTYISFGRRRIRKSLCIILIAILTLAIAGCAIAIHYNIKWNEINNEQDGTLDITLDYGENHMDISSDFDIQSKLPKTPKGYTIDYRDFGNHSLTIGYENESTGEGILLSITKISPNISISIDNEDVINTEININGYKGYSHIKDGITTIFVIDDICFYSLQGNCDYETLEKMLKDMI